MSENTNEVVALENMTSQERDSWRLTGADVVREEQVETKPEKEKVVEIKSKPEVEEAEVVATSDPEEAESGTATKTEEQKARKPGQMSYKDLRSRIAELEAKIKTGETKPAAADNEATKADAKSKADEKQRPKSTDKKADGSPKYQTWEEYEDDLLEWRAEKDRAAFKEHSTKEQLTTEKQKLEQESQKVIRSRADEARKKYSDFDAKALDPTLKIPQGSVLATWILDPSNEQGMEIAYHFGTHRDELEKFNAMTPFQQARELTRLEDKLSKMPEAPEAKASDVKVIAPPKVTKAPPPAKEVGGRGASSGDEETSVVNSGDFRAYKRVVDKKEIAARK